MKRPPIIFIDERIPLYCVNSVFQIRDNVTIGTEGIFADSLADLENVDICLMETVSKIRALRNSEDCFVNRNGERFRYFVALSDIKTRPLTPEEFLERHKVNEVISLVSKPGRPYSVFSGVFEGIEPESQSVILSKRLFSLDDLFNNYYIRDENNKRHYIGTKC